MARIPYNVNFCIFVGCQLLSGNECTVGECVFPSKLVRWWEWHQVRGATVRSVPPQDKKRVTNIYFDPDKNKYVFEREE